MKHGMINIEYGKPIKVIENFDSSTEIKETSISNAIGTTLKEYQKNIQLLIQGRYANQKDLIPLYLQKPCNIFVFICNDGVFVRYDEVNEGEAKIRTTITGKDLYHIAPMMSDSAIHFPKDFSNYLPEIRGPQLIMQKGKIENPQSEYQEVLSFYFEVFAKTELPKGHTIAQPPSRPAPLVSLSNEVTFNMYGEIIPVEIKPKEVIKEEEFITLSTVKLNVGWVAIEVYPLLQDNHWKPEYTPLWAELDILFILNQKNVIKNELTQFDSRNETRKYYIQLLKEFESLLGGLEEPVHQFLKGHPALLCPSHEKCWSKVQFGNTISDFVFKEPHNDYLLVEIEAPIRELFRNDGQQRQELTHAINQITDWVQYIQDNKQKVEQELEGISTNPRIMVVIGRSETLTNENRRKIETLQSLHNKLRIMTYDDVLINAKQSLGRLFGSLDFQGTNLEIFLKDK